MPTQPDLFAGTDASKPFAREVVDISVVDEMSESFLAYSLSVITARAIPDVRDGLKPVQRRILYSMLNMGLRPDRPHRKSAGVVGDTMGKYHPHGDGAIYDALVRMGQPFNRRVTLVDPHGNFGDLDDPPAAYRYTECRLSDAAMSMLDELDEDTVEHRSTFDGQTEEPVYLPALLPNLLVNGTTGIAVGMATNMPCHNLGEVYRAIELVMTQRRPKPSVEEMRAVLPGPDFPSGGVIVDDNISEAYATGRGSFRIRAKVAIEPVKGTKRHQIVVTELPYMVGPERVIARIKELVATDKIAGIADFNNFSGRKRGLNITIETKPGVNPQALLADLYRLTPLEDSYSVNNVVLVDGTPTTVGLWDLCSLYAEHRLDVVRRRTEYRLTKARDRLHIVDGLLIALDAIDEVIAIIRSSQDASDARTRLMDGLSLSEIQAMHILDMQLRRLTALERLKLVEERDGLQERIADYEKLLGSERRQRTVVLTELRELVERFDSPRRSVIISPDDVEVVERALAEEVMPDEEPGVAALTTTGLIGAEPSDGPKQAAFGHHDVIVTRVPFDVGQNITALTSTGRALVAPSAGLGDVAGRSRGSKVGDVFHLQKGESVVGLATPDDRTWLIVTAAGQAKRLTSDELCGTPNGRTAMKLAPDDSVVGLVDVTDVDTVIVVASNAQALRTATDAIPLQGRAAGGVAVIKLADGARVVAVGPVVDDGIVLTQTDKGNAKVTDVAEFPVKGRNTGGVRVTKFRDDTRIELAWVGRERGALVVMADKSAEPVTIPHSGRDLISRPFPQRMTAVGVGRW